MLHARQLFVHIWFWVAFDIIILVLSDEMKQKERKIQLSKTEGGYLIEFRVAQNPWTTYNDFLGCLTIMQKERFSLSAILDFSRITGALYPQVAVSIAGLIDYYRERFGFVFKVVSNPGSYIEKINLPSPSRVIEREAALRHDIFDKVIRFENHKEASFISKEIYYQLKRAVVCERGVLGGLGWCINEVMDNVFAHAGAPCGYFMAQIHNRTKVISVSVFDLGCGLLASLRRSGKLDIEDEMAAIDLATQKGVTEDIKVGQGNGLYGLSKIIEHNQSHFSILSGHCSIAYDFGKNEKITKAKTPIVSEQARSTRVDFTLNYSARIDLRTALGGYEMYEEIDKDLESMSLESGALVFKIAEKSDGDYASRASGSRLRTELLNVANSSTERIILDFSDVQMIDSSFGDELVGKIILQIGFLSFNQRFVIQNANQDIRVVLERAISIRTKELFDK